MTTRFEDKGDHYLLNGAKMWISNAPFAQIAVVWAKDENGEIRGLVVERGMEGFTTPKHTANGVCGHRQPGELVFDNVKVPKENLLPNVKGLKRTFGLLVVGKVRHCLGAIGAALDCYDAALRYSIEREQFG